MRKQTMVALLVPLSFLALCAARAFGATPPQSQNQQPQLQQPQQPQQQQKPQSQYQQPQGKGAPRVDLVIALDTSSSMDGLIDATRAKLWDVVTLLARAKPQPVLRIGLISYGNDGYPSENGWIRKESDLTTDLDAVYAKLFALRTNGGTEYVARAVHSAVHEMQWDNTEQTLRIVFVAGNEPADQDPTIPLADAAKDAIDHHVRVNTIYCGSEANVEKNGWEHLALLARGGFNSIDQNEVAAIATPMDAELAKLSDALNDTYVAYGKAAAEKKANQVAQDKNARSLGTSAAAGRAHAKASAMYFAPEWDLVDAQRASGGAALKGMSAAALPPAMAAMPAPAREAYVADKAKKRAELQQQISALAARRDGFIKSEKAKAPKKAGKAASLDDALSNTIEREATSDLKLKF